MFGSDFKVSLNWFSLQKFSNSQFTTLKCFLCISRISNTLLNTCNYLRWTSNCSYFSCHLFHELSEILVENESIMLESQKSDCWYFLPYIHPSHHHISVFYTQKSWGLHPTPGHLPDPLPPSPSCNRFWLWENQSAHICSVLSPVARFYYFWQKKKNLWSLPKHWIGSTFLWHNIIFFVTKLEKDKHLHIFNFK